MPLFRALDVCDDRSPRSAAMNMAIDEALFETAKAPIIRFYQWNHPALSFGYFGKFADVAQFGVERDLVRRWTGGGTVFHGEDLTYCIVIPSSFERIPNSSRLIYTAVHGALRQAIEDTGNPAELATADSERVSDSCFANPVPADVISRNRKVAGAAHRRTRAGLLHQGSIQNIDVSNDLAAAFARHLCSDRREVPLGPNVIERARQLAQEKYATSAWLRRW